MSADLLGAGLLLCLEGGQVNRQGTAGGDPGAWAPLPGRGVQLPGTTAATGGDCIRGCTSVHPVEGERPPQWLPLPWGWGIPVPPSHPPSFC